MLESSAPASRQRETIAHPDATSAPDELVADEPELLHHAPRCRRHSEVRQLVRDLRLESIRARDGKLEDRGRADGHIQHVDAHGDVDRQRRHLVDQWLQADGPSVLAVLLLADTAVSEKSSRHSGVARLSASSM